MSISCVISPLPCSVPVLVSLGLAVPSLGITLLFPRRIPGLILPRIPLLLRTGISMLLLLGIPSSLLLGISLLPELGMLLLLPLGLPILFPLRSAVLPSGNITFFINPPILSPFSMAQRLFVGERCLLLQFNVKSVNLFYKINTTNTYLNPSYFLSLLLKMLFFRNVGSVNLFIKQECIPVGCVPPAC